jgi:hypothetical protein
LRTLVAYLPAIACGAMMLFICIPMMRNMHKGQREGEDAATNEELAALREEVARLRAGRALAEEREAVDG